MAIGWDYLGDLTQYSTQEDIATQIKQEENRNNEPMNDSKANWEFAKKMQIGDIVYVKKGLQDALIGRGIVKSDYIYDTNRNEYQSIRKVEWTHNGIYDIDFNVLDIKQWNQKTLTEISQSKYKNFCLKIEDVFMNKQSKENLNNLQINVPLNQILYGPPGTGKTYNTIIESMKIITFEDLFKDWYLKIYCKVNKVVSENKTLNDYLKHLNKINQEYLKCDNIFRYCDYNEFIKLKENILNSKYIKENQTKNNKNSYYQHSLKRYEEFTQWLDYEKIRNKYNEYKKLGQIEFVTFHQSYSYEEFVEGIKPYLSEWGEANIQDVKYIGKDGIFKKICQRAEKELYQKKGIIPVEYATFNDVLEEFKNKYPIGVDFGNLHNLKYSENYVEYQFGKQEQYRKIELDKIKEMFNKKYEYDTAIEFNNDYNGNYALACYNYAFYKELNNIKNEINAGIQSKINKNDSGEFEINKKAPKYVLIIDEINRGNISKIFGELITLIEEDKRGKLQVKLPYSQKEFSVPENLYIIGTMNTSDRSIASIDIALRRRFTFKEIIPQKDLVPNISVFGLNLRDIFTALNERISILLDRDHQIGHSYFMKLANSENIETDFQRIWYDCIMPLLNEYFYGDWEKLRAILGETQKDGKSSFIKKIENVKFAIKYDCDDDDKYDFVKEIEPNFDFKMALENAFWQKVDKPKDDNSGE